MKYSVADLRQAIRKRLHIFALWLHNRFGRSPVADGTGPIVSLTTHGTRLGTAYLAIESIGLGDTKPRRLLLWLSPPESNAPLPGSVTRLQRRGLEVMFCDDLGPHKKYYPYVSTTAHLRHPLATAADDILYPRSWLRMLDASWHEHPTAISCHRAWVVAVNDGTLIPYAQWSPCFSTTSSPLNFATGVSGILYPPLFQELMRAAGDGFLRCAPRGDDIWLHALAAENDYPIRQVARAFTNFPFVPGTAATGLFNENLAGGGNDAQIAQTYSAGALQALTARELLERPPVGS